MNDKKYINQCSLKEKTFDNGGSVINAAFNVSELEQHQNEGGWVNIVIAKRREPSEKGATHYAYVSDFKPKYKTEESSEEPVHDDNLPF